MVGGEWEEFIGIVRGLWDLRSYYIDKWLLVSKKVKLLIGTRVQTNKTLLLQKFSKIL